MKINVSGLAGCCLGAASAASFPWVLDGGLVKWAALAVVAGVLLFRIRRLDWTDFAVLAFAAYAGLSLLWTPDPQFGLYSWVKLLLCVVLFISLRGKTILPIRQVGAKTAPGWRKNCANSPTVLTWAAAVGVGLTLLQVPFGWVAHGGFANENLATEFLLVAMPSLLTPWFWPLAVASAVYLIGWNPSKLELVSVGLVALWRPRYTVPVLAILGAVAVWYGVHVMNTSVISRLELWAATASMWASAPVFGNGLGSFAYLYPAHGDAAMLLGLPQKLLVEDHVFAAAAHNDLLQLFAELGSVGVVGLGIILFQIRPCAIPVATLALLGLLSLVGFPLQSPATAILGALALSEAAGPRRAAVRPPPWLTAALGTIPVMGLWYGAFLAVVSGTYMQAMAVLTDRLPVEAFQANHQAVRVFPWDRYARFQLFRSLVKAENTGVRVSVRDGERVYGLSRSASPDHIGLVLPRLKYLVTHRRCGTECDELLAKIANSRTYQAKKTIERLKELHGESHRADRRGPE